MTIDVTELLDDPDFVMHDLVAISRAQPQCGRTENTEMRTTFPELSFPNRQHDVAHAGWRAGNGRYQHCDPALPDGRHWPGPDG